MKSILVQISLFFALAAHSAKASPPIAFDPRQNDQKLIEGSCYVFQAPLISENYLIVTCPDKDNPDRTFFIYQSSADSFRTVTPYLGKFVVIKAVRVKQVDKNAPPFCIVSAQEVGDF